MTWFAPGAKNASEFAASATLDGAFPALDVSVVAVPTGRAEIGHAGSLDPPFRQPLLAARALRYARRIGLRERIRSSKPAGLIGALIAFGFTCIGLAGAIVNALEQRWLWMVVGLVCFAWFGVLLAGCLARFAKPS
jgi:hypothetical protein